MLQQFVEETFGGKSYNFFASAVSPPLTALIYQQIYITFTFSSFVSSSSTSASYAIRHASLLSPDSSQSLTLKNKIH